MRSLQAVAASGGASFTDPMLEQVKQCPEAFQAGEFLGKMFDAVKYDFGEANNQDRLLPPPGAVMPLV
jgi:hypothetical protein